MADNTPTVAAPVYNAYTTGGQTISLADAARISQQKMAFEAYYGRLPKPLRARPRQADDSVMTNRCRPVVDKGVSFLFGSDIRFEIVTDDDGFLEAESSSTAPTARSSSSTM